MRNMNRLQNNFRRFWLIGVFLSISFPAVASHNSPAVNPAIDAASTSVGNPAIIRQLNTIESTLAVLDGKLDALKVQLQSVDDRLNAKLDTALAKLDLQGADLAFLVEDAESVEKDIKISNTLCFSASVFHKIDLGIKTELGAGWSLAANVKAAAALNGTVLGYNLNLAEKICINVPLYKVASDPLADFDNTEDFDQLIADIVAPSQAVIPLVATLYTAVMPSKDQAIEVTANVIEASTGLDIYTGVIGAPHLESFLRPDIMFAPILTDPYQEFVNFIPGAFASLAADPCAALANSPLQINVNSVPICVIGAGAGHIAFNLVDPLHLLHPNSGVFPDI